MDKNSIIGLILIAAILFGFTWFQGKKGREMAAQQAAADSIALAQKIARGEIDTTSTAFAEVPEAAAAASTAQTVYKDSLLERLHSAEETIVALENDLFKIEFTTRGAQPYSVKLKNYYNFDSTALYIFKPGQAEYSASIYTGEFISTKDFTFEIAEHTDSTLVMRLPFANGGCLEQIYNIKSGSYSLDNNLALIGMQNSIPRNVSSIDFDIMMNIPRMEKGYKNESQYSKLDYCFEGEKGIEEIGRGRNASKRVDSKFGWFAFQQQFFCAIVRSPKEFSSGELSVNFFSQDDSSRNLMAGVARLRAEYKSAERVDYPLEFYFGPNSYTTLKEYGHKYEKIIPMGGSIVGWFTKYAIIPMFNWFNRFFTNYGLIILLMTIVIKIVVFPLTYKSFASSAKMAALKPEMEKLSAKFPKQEDAMKKQQATMDLYKRAGVSPMGGCLPTLLTFPILWAMFRFFPASIELRQQSFLWCHDLSSYDSILDFGTRIPLLGDHLSLFALLMAVTMWFYSKFTMASQPSGADPTAKSMQYMTLCMMPIMMFFICNNLSAALSYYYLLSQLIMIIQNLIIRRTIDTNAVLEKVKATEGKPLPKSKFQQRLEAAQKMQQQQLKEQQKKQRR